jgi:hypothetical protein
MHHRADNAAVCHKELQLCKTDFQSHLEAPLMVMTCSEIFLCHFYCNRNNLSHSHELLVKTVATDSLFHDDKNLNNTLRVSDETYMTTNGNLIMMWMEFVVTI